MKKFILLFCLTAIHFSCRKEDQECLSRNTNQPLAAEEKIVAIPQYRGLYVDDFATILGDTVKENQLLSWCQRNSINAISLYNLITILQNTSVNNTLLAAFIKRSKLQYGIKQVAAIRGSDSGFIETMNLYNNTRTDTLERFNVLNLENEWWNNGPACDFNCYKTDLVAMKSCATAASPKLIKEEYIGWLRNPDLQEASQCSTLIANSDRILVHDYRTTPDFSYMQSRLSFIGSEAKKAE